MNTRRTFIKKSTTLAVGVTLLDSIIFSPVASAAGTPQPGCYAGSPDLGATNWDEACDNSTQHNGIYERDNACKAFNSESGTNSRDQSCGHPTAEGFDLDSNCGNANADGPVDPDEACLHVVASDGSVVNTDQTNSHR